MIVPSSRLLFWFALVAVPFSLLGAVYPNALGVSVALISALLVVALLDVALSFSRLDDIMVELPDLVRLSKDRYANLTIRVTKSASLALKLRIGLALPQELETSHDDFTVALASDIKTSALDWPFTPKQRGNFRVTKAFLETPSSLGLWAIRRTTPVRCEIRVYPNLPLFYAKVDSPDRYLC